MFLKQSKYRSNLKHVKDLRKGYSMSLLCLIQRTFHNATEMQLNIFITYSLKYEQKYSRKKQQHYTKSN